MKDRKCQIYFHTYKCVSKSCEGCKYRMIDNQDFIEMVAEIKNSGMPKQTQEKLIELLEKELKAYGNK